MKEDEKAKEHDNRRGTGEKSPNKKNERRQPKFDKKKNPPGQGGDGLTEYVSDQPNLKPGDQKEKRKENKKHQT